MVFGSVTKADDIFFGVTAFSYTVGHERRDPNPEPH